MSEIPNQDLNIEAARSRLIQVGGIWRDVFVNKARFPKGMDMTSLRDLYAEGYGYMGLLGEADREIVLGDFSEAVSLKEGRWSPRQKRYMEEINELTANPASRPISGVHRGKPALKYEDIKMMIAPRSFYETGEIKLLTVAAFIFYQANYEMFAHQPLESREYVRFLTTPEAWRGIELGNVTRLKDIIKAHSRWLPSYARPAVLEEEIISPVVLEPSKEVIEEELDEASIFAEWADYDDYNEDDLSAKDLEWDEKIAKRRGGQRLKRGLD